jgi:beta-lactamase class A
MFADLGATDEATLARRLPTLSRDRLAGFAVLDPARTNAGIARDMTRLLSLIWRDAAGPAPACAQVHQLMRWQACWHRLAAAFDHDVAVAAKSGTVFDVRNEVGVAQYPDGHRHAIAVFTTGGWGLRRADVDQAIGRTARLAVDRLRAG